MGRLLSLVIVLAIAGGGAYLFLHQAQNATGNGNPASAVDLVGVRRDLLNIAQAERSYQTSHSGLASISELHTSGELNIDHDNRGPYNYSVESTSSGFRVTATYTGPENAGVAKSISVDETMHFSQE
ncbi:MAG: hypothetical protein LAP21_04710 [Acidobacteriia bacterium]|nr:hypothetical protein [Terriglobia bacterium]